MCNRELIGRTNIQGDSAFCKQSFKFGGLDGRQGGQVGERRGSGAIDFRVLEKVFRASRQIAGQLRDELFPALYL